MTFTATVATVAPGAGTATGTVTFKEGATTLGTGTLSGGAATFTTSGLILGGHLITAVYGGDGNFTSSTSSALTQTVNKAATATAVSSSLNPSVFGQSVTFTATVAAVAPGAGTATGTVTFKDGAAIIGTGTLSGGTASYSTATLLAGSRSITAVYSSDGNFTASTSSALTQTVNQSATATAVTSSVNPSVFGQSVTFTATVAAVAPGAGTATGAVTFKDGATVLGTGALGSGTATFATSALTAASHSITAVYGGDGNFTSSTSSVLTQTVNQTATTAAVNSSANPSVIGQSVTFTATVSAVAPGAGTATGTVTFKDGATTLGSGTLSSGSATFATSGLILGGHSITAVYAGDSNFTGSTSSALSQTVNQAATTTTISSSLNPSTVGQSVTFTANVSVSAPGAGAPTGNVTFKDGATTLGVGTVSGGTAAFSTAGLSQGNHSITAVYGGDSNFTSSTSSSIAQVVRGITTTALSASVNPTVFGQPVIFTATVTGIGSPTGTVTFADGATTLGSGTLSSGTATFTTSALSVASHSITAVYSGDSAFAPSTSTILTQTVNQASTATSIASSANPSVVGQSVTFTATVGAVAPGSGTATGTITFKDGATTLGTGTLSAGSATFATSTLILGNHSITASYGGDGNFVSSSSSALSQTVNQAATTTIVNSSLNPSTVGQSVTFTATINVAAPGSGVATGTVTFMDGAATLGTGTLSSGVAGITTSGLAIGSHSITVAYSGDSNFTASTSPVLTQVVRKLTTTAIASSPNPTVFGQATAFTATVTGSGTPTGTVSFADGGTLLGVASLAGGTASLTSSNLLSGSHSITASYSGDAAFGPSISLPLAQAVNQAATATVITSAANPSVVGQPATFTATVSAVAPGTGTPTGTVSFSDGGTALASVPLSGGTATLITSALAQGNHSITATYSGDGNFNQSVSAAISQTVIAYPVVTSPPSLSVGTVFNGQSVNLSVGATDPANNSLTYTWDFGDGSTGSGSSVDHVYATAGTFTVTVTISNGFASTTNTMTITVNPFKTVQPSKQKFTVNLKAFNHDTLDITFNSQDFIAAANFQTVNVYIGKMNIESFVFSKGRGKGVGTMQGKARTGVVRYTIRNFDLRSILTAQGINTDVAQVIVLPISFDVNGTRYGNIFTFQYKKAKSGRSGSGTGP